jgi:hypothetical protein
MLSNRRLNGTFLRVREFKRSNHEVAFVERAASGCDSLLHLCVPFEYHMPDSIMGWRRSNHRWWKAVFRLFA